MGGGGERINSLADLVPGGRDGERLIPGLRDYLSDSFGLQTDNTFGNESNQLQQVAVIPEADKPDSEAEAQHGSIITDGRTKSIAQLIAMVSRK